MRGLPVSVFFIFMLVYIGIEIISFTGLYRSMSRSTRRQKVTFSILYWAVALYIVAAFLYTFANPERLKNTTSYGYFNFVLVLTFFNLVPKAILSLFTIITGIISLINKYIGQVIFTSGLIIVLGVMLTMAYSVLADKKQIRVEEISLSFDSLPEQLDGLTIVQISDIHLGSLNGDKAIVRKTCKIIEKLKPGLLLFTGDMVNNFSPETEGYVRYFREMKADYGKLAITGNHDYGDYYQWRSPGERTENLAAIRDSIREMGFDLLLNENRRIVIGDTTLYIIGVENWGHDPFPQYADIDKATAGIPPGAFSILMSHDPAHWQAQVIPHTNILLTLAGHTHGLQFGFRLAGIEFSPMFFIQKHWGGLYRQDNRFLYVNRGLGTIGFAGRVEMRPEITKITIRRKQ
ncbi:MAG: metallophosphoesterase [Prolixibacteraceae bacterium]|jgi:predicted MPP superfamily phosphohydrolase|nr:metallophosphoesterase [Prolixibacteraceae bacterium]